MFQAKHMEILFDALLPVPYPAEIITTLQKVSAA